MPKTGRTQITRILEDVEGGREVVKHRPLDVDPDGRLVISSVRDPWDWYVSLWAYGCSERGGVHGALLAGRTAGALKRQLEHAGAQPAALARALYAWSRQRRTDVGTWRNLYGNPRDVDLFRRWLTYFLDERGKRDLVEGYGDSHLRHVAGFMTYRFLRIGTPRRTWARGHEGIRTPAELAAYADAHWAVQAVIRMERLEDDVADILRSLGHDVSGDELRIRRRTNSSERLDTSVYYDDATADLFAREEALLVERYGYAPPGSPARLAADG